MKRLFVIGAIVLLSGTLTLSVMAVSGTETSLGDSERPQNVNGFKISTYPLLVDRSLMGDDRLQEVGDASTPQLRPLGSTSTDYGIGVGESIDVTVHDYQVPQGSGRQIVHWYNGLTGPDAEVSVHFAYQDARDIVTTAYGFQYPWLTYSGYNVYDATVPGGDWPRGQDEGCDLEAIDTAGEGWTSSIDMMFNGRAVLASWARVRIPSPPDTTSHAYYDDMIYYQGGQYSCAYNPAQSLNVTWVDSTVYRDNFIIPPGGQAGVYLRTPQVRTQFDGSNTVVHLLAGEDAQEFRDATYMTGPHFVTGETYWSWMYFRKVGDRAEDGAWSAGQTIDTIWFPWADLACAAYPHQGVAVVYTNPTVWAGMLENPDDKDVWCRESFDRGLTWQPSYSITNYDNATYGTPNHFTAWVESHCMFDSEGDLHAYWPAKPTSANPYYDGFNWKDFDQNLYHWEKTNGNTSPGVGDIVKVANGNFMNDDMLSGSMNTHVCGWGGCNAGYLAFATMGECNGKLYMVWSQIHERANWNNWRNALIQPAPGILDDCSHTGVRGARANWELMMSVARLETSTLWDYPRNITNTYTPDCGLPGDPAANGLCGSEWRSCLEEQALDETGLDLYWPPATEVDLTPLGEPAYSGGWYLNMEYLDDVFPGPAYWGHAGYFNPPPTENSEKWIRLACVEPILDPRLDAIPRSISWPQWVPFGQTTSFMITTVNEGNVLLEIDSMGTVGGSWLTVSVNPTTQDPFVVPAGISNTRTFDIRISTEGLSQLTWLDGEVWLLSNAASRDSLSISLHILAADAVEPVVWDTVMTHADMYGPFFAPVGACVGLAVGNMGELGWGGGRGGRPDLLNTGDLDRDAGNGGRVNLDYTDASGMPIARRECDTTVSKNRIYLVSATPYVILANGSDGSGAEMTQNFSDPNQTDVTGFDPIGTKGNLIGGLNAVKGYDSVYTGRFVNRDSSIAMERIVYGPHPATGIINFMIVYTKVYSGDGLPHNHVTIGNAADWDVPSNRFNHNLGGISDGFVYLQGTDTIGTDNCASNVGRFATEAFGGGYTTAEFQADSCSNDLTYKGTRGVHQSIMVDTAFYRDGTPLVPSQPNPLLWWQTAEVGGLSIDPIPDTGMNLAVFLTYKHDYNLAALDTLHYWTVITTTPIGGTLAELAAQVNYAKCWYTETVRGCSCGCWVGRVGDANMSQETEPDEVTLGDIMLLVDVKFISGDCTNLTCIAEADVNQDGGSVPTCDDNVTLGDIMVLVDHLFISNTPLKECL
jgi:hypothetical protein